MLVLFLFILVVLHLVFRFGDKQSISERAVVSLTNLINQLDDIVYKSQNSGEFLISDCDIARQKYESVIQVIPPNTDKEFLSAKKDFQEKESKKIDLLSTPYDLFDEDKLRKITKHLIQESEPFMKALQTIRNTGDNLYIGGGMVRNLVWDYLHSHKASTPIEDIDIVYFDKLSTTKEHDKKIEEKLSKSIPNLKWSVKNQARMHAKNNEPEYESLEDAISKWPETATAFAARINGESTIEIIAPHGFSDLYRLIVAPTPHFEKNKERYLERVKSKQWESTWPKLRIFGV